MTAPLDLCTAAATSQNEVCFMPLVRNSTYASSIIRCFKFGSISHLHYIKNSTDAINNPNVAVEKPRDEVDTPVLYVLI